MKTELLHRIGKVAILFLVLLLLAQGASSSNVTINSNKNLVLDGKEIFPIMMSETCNWYWDGDPEADGGALHDQTYDTCAQSFAKLNNFSIASQLVNAGGSNYINMTINNSKNYSQYWMSVDNARGTNFTNYWLNDSMFLGWWLFPEEPYDATTLDDVKAEYDTIKTYDPNHPVFLPTYEYAISGASIPNVSGATDYILWTGYSHKTSCDSPNMFLNPWDAPICTNNLYYLDDFIFDWERNIKTKVGSNLSAIPDPIVVTIEAFGENWSEGTASNWKVLSKQKLRAITYSSVVAGVKGITYWGNKYWFDHNNSTVKRSSALTQNDTIAEYYNALGGELISSQMQDILLLPRLNGSWTTAVAWDEKVNFSTNPTKTIPWGSYTGKSLTYLLKYNSTSGKNYLVVVNKNNVSINDVVITISGLSGSLNATTLGIVGTGSGAPGLVHSVADGVFTDTFDAYAAHVYEISSATTWTISGSGGDATWSGNSNADNVTEDNGDHDIKIGIFADNFDDNDISSWTTTWGTHSASNGMYNQTTAVTEWMTARPTTFSYTSPAVIMAKVNVTDNGTYLDQGLGWGSSTFNASTDIFAGRRDYVNQWELRRNEIVDSNSTASRTLNVWSNLQLYKKSNSYNYSSSYDNVLMSTSNSPTNSQYPYLLGSSDLLQYWDDVRIVPLGSNGNVIPYGNLTTWYNWTDGNVTYQVVVNATTPANTNYSVYYRQNATGDYVLLNGTGHQGNTSHTITTQYQNTDVRVQLFGNETATPEIIQIIYYSQAPVTYAPNITSWSNTKTNNDTANITVNASESVTFNATANQSIATWNWYVNGSNQNNNYDNISLSYTSDGTRIVVVNATNSNGTSTSIQWNMTVVVPDTSTTWTTGIGGQFFQNKTIGNNNSCVNQGDGSLGVNCESIGTDNFNDNNMVGWNISQVSGSTTFALANGSLNISGGGMTYLNQNTTNYTNKAMFLEVTHYNNIMSYVEIDLMGNLSRGTPQKMVQFSTAAGSNRTHIYAGDAWTVINNTKSMPMFVGEKQYLVFMSNGSNPIYYRGYISNISFSDALTNSLISGYNNTWLNGSTVQFGGNFNISAIVNIDNTRTVNLSSMGIQTLNGNYSMNYTVPASQYAKNITVNGSYPASTNYSLKYRQNATGNYVSVGGVQTSNATIELPTPYYQNIDIMLEMNASTSDTLWISNITMGTSTSDAAIADFTKVDIIWWE